MAETIYITFLTYLKAIYGQKSRKEIDLSTLATNQDLAQFVMTVALKRAETKLTAYGPCIKNIIKTLRCNDSTATRTSLSFYIAIIPTHLLCQTEAKTPEFGFQKTISKFRKRNKISFCLSAFSIKREINKIHVVVVQKRQGNVQKRATHVQSCCFAYETYCCYFFDVLVAVASLDLKIRP